MKMIEIKKEYNFQQKTFYQWLRDEGLIQYADTGYVIGPNALPGMDTLIYSMNLADKQYKQQSQVIIEDANVPLLVEKYIHSGLPNLYTKRGNNKFLEKQLVEANEKIAFLEGQVNLLKNLLEHSS